MTLDSNKDETNRLSPTLEINSERGRYPIYIGNRVAFSSGLWNTIFESIKGVSKLLIVTDDQVDDKHVHFFEWLDNFSQSGIPRISIKKIVLPSGEKSKSIEFLDRLWDEMAAFEMTRKDILVTVGGGVMGDLSGFAASTFNRGVRWIQIPTTLLSQVDSSVGGKVAINRKTGKNLVGTFYSPDAVVIDIAFLGTLPKRQISNGLGEVIKHGYIYDKSILEKIDELTCMSKEKNSNAAVTSFIRDIEGTSTVKFEETLTADAVWIDLITNAVRVKAQVVEQDEKECGVRAILNFGHTYAHGIEAALSFDKCLHGEAVGLGMLFALAFGEWLTLQKNRMNFGGIGITSSELAEKAWESESVHLLKKRLASVGLPVSLELFGLGILDAIDYICHDKKRVGDFISFVLVDEEGISRIEDVHLSTIEEFARISTSLKIETI